MSGSSDTSFIFKADNLRLNHMMKEVPLDSPYVEPGLDRLSVKFINMTMQEMIISYATFQVAGIIRGKISSPEQPYQSETQKHEGFELVYVLKGHIIEKIDEITYELHEGDALLMNKNCKNSLINFPGSLVIGIGIGEAFLKQYDSGNRRFQAFPLDFVPFFQSGLNSPQYQNADYLLFFQKANAPKREVSEIRQILHTIHDELRKKRPGYQSIISGLFCRLLHCLNAKNSYQISIRQIPYQSAAELAESIRCYLDHSRKKITVTKLAEIFHFHANYIEKVFKKTMGESIRQYNLRICMQEAASLLEENHLSVSQVASLVGYASRSQFYQAFEKFYGYPPNKKRFSGKTDLS